MTSLSNNVPANQTVISWCNAEAFREITLNGKTGLLLFFSHVPSTATCATAAVIFKPDNYPTVSLILYLNVGASALQLEPAHGELFGISQMNCVNNAALCASFFKSYFISSELLVPRIYQRFLNENPKPLIVSIQE